MVSADVTDTINTLNYSAPYTLRCVGLLVSAVTCIGMKKKSITVLSLSSMVTVSDAWPLKHISSNQV